MGTSIFGSIEYRPFDTWYEVIKASTMMSGYDMVGCLFGIRNYANFEPLAERRGIPDDASYSTNDINEENYFGQSWIGLEEIREIDWSEKADDFDSRTHFYDSEGNYLHKSVAFNLEFKEKTEEDLDIIKQLEEKGELELTLDEDMGGNGPEKGEKVVLKREKITKEDAKSPEWEALFCMMNCLGERYGEENVRLVVWFGN